VITIIGPADGESVDFGGLGVRFVVTGEGFSLVEHPIAGLQARYALTMDRSTAATICEREGLPLPPRWGPGGRQRRPLRPSAVRRGLS
jgi:hypothetical protein